MTNENVLPPPSLPPCLPAQRLTHTFLVPLFQTHENRCIISFVCFGHRLNLSSARHTRYITCRQIAIINLSNRWRSENSSTAHLEWVVWNVRCVYGGGRFQTLKSYEVKTQQVPVTPDRSDNQWPLDEGKH